MTQNEKSRKDLVDYIMSDPEVVWSGAMRSYRKLYKKYLNICRTEFHDAQVGIFNKHLVELKHELMIKLQKLKRVLSSSNQRNFSRKDNTYVAFKRKKFGEKLDKF